MLLPKLDGFGLKMKSWAVSCASGNGRCNITNVNAEGFSEVTSFLSSLGLGD